MYADDLLTVLEVFLEDHGNAEVLFVDVKAEVIEITYVDVFSDETKVELISSAERR